jgi:Tfp pilus assembly protein PilF
VLSYLACCHCKEVCVALPPLLWAFDRAFLADRWRTVVRERGVPHLAILAVWGYTLRPVIAGAAGGAEAAGIGFGLNITPFQYLLTETEVLLHYLRLAVWPTGQVGDALDWPVAKSVGEVAPALAAVVALFLTGAVLLYLRPAVGFLFAWFFVVLGPTSSVVPIRDVMFEHRMYLPLVAVLTGLVFAADAALRAVPFRYSLGRPAVALTLLAVAAVALGRATAARNAVYRTNNAFLENAYAVRPDNLRAKGSVANIRLTEGRYDEARKMLDEVGAVNPTVTTYRIFIGHIAYLNGRFERAADYFRGLLADPWEGMSRYVYRFLIPCELAAKRYADAATHAREHVAKFPDSGPYRLILAACELSAGDPAAARIAAADALVRDPAAATTLAAEARQALFAKHPVPAAQGGLWEVAYWWAAAANLAANDANPEWLDTQAQLAARLGRFADAKAVGAKGVAASATDPVWKAAHEERLMHYRKNEVYGPKD